MEGKGEEKGGGKRKVKVKGWLRGNEWKGKEKKRVEEIGK